MSISEILNLLGHTAVGAIIGLIMAVLISLLTESTWKKPDSSAASN